MLDLPNWIWNTLFIILFIFVCLMLWLDQRSQKSNNVIPRQPVYRFKKYRKKLTKGADIIILLFILFSTIVYGFMFFSIAPPPDIPYNDDQEIARLALSSNILLLLNYSTATIFMASLLSPFEKHITLTKRLILVAMCCIPLVLGTFYVILDSSQNLISYVKVLLYTFFPVVFINWPAILLGRPFVEFYSKLFRKIPFLPNSEPTENPETNDFSD